MKYKHLLILLFIFGLMACSKTPSIEGPIKDPRAKYTFNPSTEGDLSTVSLAYIKFLNNPEYIFKMYPYPPKPVKDPDSITAIVNREFKLDQDYQPDDLVLFEGLTNGSDQYLRQEAADALLTMFQKALEQGHQLIASSSYRSYQTQQRIYNQYAAIHGLAKANTFSALPGHSEHQLGLAVDISSIRFNGMITSRIKDTPEGRWVRDNAHFFGFIIRYTNQNQYITGYIDEPWHLRYVGSDLASYLKTNVLTLEQAKYGQITYGLTVESFP